MRVGWMDFPLILNLNTDALVFIILHNIVIKNNMYTM